MTDWTVTIETTLGVAAGDEALETIHDALNGDPATAAPAVTFHVPLPILTARFDVEADSTDEAEDLGRSAFERALEAAGVTAMFDVSVSDGDPV